MNERVQIILDRYKDDYPKAMGELNVRRIELEKRLLSHWVFGKERIAVREELNCIIPLLISYQQSKK